MDHALRVDHDLDLLRAPVEYPLRLAPLESLVHHGRGINRYLSSHNPVRMRARLLRCDIRQVLRLDAAKRAARSREHDPQHSAAPQSVAVFARQSLEDGVVLAVTWHQPSPMSTHRLHEDGA